MNVGTGFSESQIDEIAIELRPVFAGQCVEAIADIVPGDFRPAFDRAVAVALGKEPVERDDEAMTIGDAALAQLPEDVASDIRHACRSAALAAACRAAEMRAKSAGLTVDEEQAMTKNVLECIRLAESAKPGTVSVFRELYSDIL